MIQEASIVSELELGVVALALVALVVAIKLRRTLTTLTVNAILGLIVLLVANVLGAGVDLSIWAVLVCAIAGIPGAMLVTLLAYLDIAFAVGFTLFV